MSFDNLSLSAAADSDLDRVYAGFWGTARGAVVGIITDDALEEVVIVGGSGMAVVAMIVQVWSSITSLCFTCIIAGLPDWNHLILLLIIS